jgi:hypothetical protein
LLLEERTHKTGPENCGRKHSDPHHLGFMQPRALDRKVSDEFVLPPCRIHHREVHRVSDERVWLVYFLG